MGSPGVRTTFAFETTLWEDLHGHLDSTTESAGVILARTATTDKALTFLGRSIAWVPDDSYTRREPYRLEIKSTGYVPALAAAAAHRCIPVFFHTHPGGSPSPSELDDAVDDQLRALFQRRARTEFYVSLILGGSASEPRFSGRVYKANGPSTLPIDRIRIIGQRLDILQSNPDTGSSMVQYDRQIRAFGKQGQSVLNALHVGIVGAGATGSAVFEQLVRLGVGQLTVMDDDIVETTNLSRLHEAALADLGRTKVDVLAARAEAIRPGIEVNAVSSRLRTEAACRELVDCDLVFGCTDDAYGRSVLSRFSYWYLAPVIDMGFVIDVRHSTVHGLFGRVTVLEPGTACLLCRGRLSPQEIALEAMSQEERSLRASEGYAPGLGQPDPSVVAYTTLIASQAVSEMLARLFRIGDAPPAELILRVADRRISRNSREGKPGHYCVDQGRWALGDEEPMLGQLWPS